MTWFLCSWADRPWAHAEEHGEKRFGDDESLCGFVVRAYEQHLRRPMHQTWLMHRPQTCASEWKAVLLRGLSFVSVLSIRIGSLIREKV